MEEKKFNPEIAFVNDDGTPMNTEQKIAKVTELNASDTLEGVAFREYLEAGNVIDLGDGYFAADIFAGVEAILSDFRDMLSGSIRPDMGLGGNVGFFMPGSHMSDLPFGIGPGGGRGSGMMDEMYPDLFGGMGSSIPGGMHGPGPSPEAVMRELNLHSAEYSPRCPDNPEKEMSPESCRKCDDANCIPHSVALLVLGQSCDTGIGDEYDGHPVCLCGESNCPGRPIKPMGVEIPIVANGEGGEQSIPVTMADQLRDGLETLGDKGPGGSEGGGSGGK